jgi:hypothetical protein
MLFLSVQVRVAFILINANQHQPEDDRPDMKNIVLHLCGQRRDEQEFPSRHGPRRQTPPRKVEY